MKDHELKNIHPELIYDVLSEIEESFDIKFGDSEFEHITTFGEFCDHIANKIQLDNSDDCTTQQAFYKLRNAISSTLNIDNKTVTTDFPLNVLFPKESRRTKIAELENYLGFQLDILSPPLWVIITLLVLLLASIPLLGASFAALFSKGQDGLLGLLTTSIGGLLISIGGFCLANKLGNELDVQTVGQAAKKMTRENYLKSRRNPKTFNKSEIEKVLTDLFSNDLDLDKSKLTREAKFV